MEQGSTWAFFSVAEQVHKMTRTGVNVNTGYFLESQGGISAPVKKIIIEEKYIIKERYFRKESS